ncbi:hypothetical protein [Flintibacter muris]|uniref:hypothetical protein n=1 Tax=Flintibacter muris TaxID=2941327 RepID=UPI00203AFBB5|nr:hypothetical protein [Flintibacter muris]
MKQNMPYTPFSTHLSRSAREMEIRLRNIMSGPKKRPPLPFLILIFSVCIFCGNIVSCQFRDETPPDTSEPASSQQEGPGFDAQLNEMVLDYFQSEYNTTAYLAENTPETPQEGDTRLDSAVLLGTDTLDEKLFGLYQIGRSQYSQRMGQLEWQQYSPTYLVFPMDTAEVPIAPPICFNYYQEGMAPGDAIRQAVWGLKDLEVCLFRDGFSTPNGPGNWVDSMFQDFEPEIIVHEDWDPIYWPGDYWEEWSVDNGGDTGEVSAIRYYNAAENSRYLQRLETSRTDMYTPRGIRVGSTREEVLAAYPGMLFDEKNWQWAYPDDYLWYCANEDGLGPCLYFFFADDVVYMIQMVDMFN